MQEKRVFEFLTMCWCESRRDLVPTSVVLECEADKGEGLKPILLKIAGVTFTVERVED